MTNPTHLIADGVRVLTTPQTPRAKWLTLRRTGIGGSDALAVAGLDPWRSPLGVWLEKTGHPDAPEVEETPAMRWGHILEEPLAHWFTEQTGIKTHQCGMLGHPSIPWQLYSPDRLSDDGGIVEFKTTSPWNADQWDNGLVPDRAELQVQHGLSVTGKSHAHVVVGIWGQEPGMRLVKRDEALISDLLKIEGEFWEKVASVTPPPLGGHPTDSSLLTHLYPHGETGNSVELTDKAYEALVAYKEAAGRIDDLQAERERLRALIAVELGEAAEGTYEGKTVITWRNTGPVNEKLLRANLPDLAAHYTMTKLTLDSKALYAERAADVAPFRSRRFLPSLSI